MSHLVRLGLISEGVNTWPLYVAQRRRFFELERIDVQVTVTGSSVTQQQALIRGDYDIGFQQADHVVRAVEQGADLFIFMAMGHAPDLTLVGARDVTKINELAGRTVAVDGARTGYALLLRQLLARHGLCDSDIVFQELGGSQERFNAMKRGAVSASLLNSPFDANLIDAGYVALARMNEAFPSYPGPVMAARRAWASSHDKALLAFVRAWVAAYAWLQDARHRNEAIALLPERLAVAPHAATSAFTQFAQRARPALTDLGLQQVIDTVWVAETYRRPKGQPSKYLDLSYAEGALGAT
jgi:ABC-type nitrate/sulfonate/bicarbonate transport system substrate-binding protein